MPAPAVITPVLRQPEHPRTPGASPSDRSHEESEVREKSDPVVRCRFCRHQIARAEDRIPVDGQWAHTFANPHGIVFQIVCFRQAAGCADIGAYTTEFTWFSGYAWRVAMCRACANHLGWRFHSLTDDDFYGLIVDHLIFPA